MGDATAKTATETAEDEMLGEQQKGEVTMMAFAFFSGIFAALGFVDWNQWGARFASGSVVFIFLSACAVMFYGGHSRANAARIRRLTLAATADGEVAAGDKVVEIANAADRRYMETLGREWTLGRAANALRSRCCVRYDPSAARINFDLALWCPAPRSVYVLPESVAATLTWRLAGEQKTEPIGIGQSFVDGGRRKFITIHAGQAEGSIGDSVSVADIKIPKDADVSVAVNIRGALFFDDPSRGNPQWVSIHSSALAWTEVGSSAGI